MTDQAAAPVLRYTRTAMILHWLIAVLIAINVATILVVEHIPEGWVRPAVDTHKSIGITVLGLVLLRILWRIANPPPPLPDAYPQWEKKTSHVAHIALYALILALPITGWLHDSAYKEAAKYPMSLFYLVPWPRISFIMNLEPQFRESFHVVTGAMHVWLGYILYGLFALHVGAALKHQWIDKKPELERMLPR